MTINNGKTLGDIGFFTRPSSAVKNFATGSLEYALFAQDQLALRIPLIDQSAVYISRRINDRALFRCGSWTQQPITSIEEYGSVVDGIKDKKVDNKTYLEAQQSMLTKHLDADYLKIIGDVFLPEDEERSYRANKKMEFESNMPKEVFQNLILSGFHPDLHKDSNLFESQFKKLNKEAQEKIGNSEEYAAYIGSLDKMVGSILDERETKTKTPVLLYKSQNINPEVGQIIDTKISKGTIQTRNSWDNNIWKEAMDSFEEIFEEEHTAEKGKIKEEIKNGCYGNINISELSTIVLQKLGLV
jgi:hypothetical protein